MIENSIQRLYKLPSIQNKENLIQQKRIPEKTHNVQFISAKIVNIGFDL